jgi:20S proteasome subunit beta 6
LIDNDRNVIYLFIFLGSGALFRYDAVGSYEKVQAACVGKGEKMIQPILDDCMTPSDDEFWPEFLSPNRKIDSNVACNHPRRLYVNMNQSEAYELIKNAFRAAAEREITIGDGVQVFILTRRECATTDSKSCEFIII